MEHFRRSCRHGNGTGTGLYVQDTMQRALQQAFSHSSDSVKVGFIILNKLEYLKLKNVYFNNRNSTVICLDWLLRKTQAQWAGEENVVGAGNKHPVKKIPIIQRAGTKRIRKQPLQLYTRAKMIVRWVVNFWNYFII